MLANGPPTGVVSKILSYLNLSFLKQETGKNGYLGTNPLLLVCIKERGNGAQKNITLQMITGRSSVKVRCF